MLKVKCIRALDILTCASLAEILQNENICVECRSCSRVVMDGPQAENREVESETPILARVNC